MKNKALLLFLTCISISGCFMDHKTVEYHKESCEDAGGTWYVSLNRDNRALAVTCTINGVKYSMNSKGEWQ